MNNPKPVVVVIEHDPPIRRFLRTGLSTHGFIVFEADNGKHPAEPRFHLIAYSSFF